MKKPRRFDNIPKVLASSTGRQKPLAECGFCLTHSALCLFTTEAYLSLARKVVFRLQRIQASGVYGDDYRHKTLWDEYCHEVLEGPHELLECTWDGTIDPIITAVVEAVPREEAALLTIGAIWDLDRDDDEFSSAPNVVPHLIQLNLRRVVAQLAGARNMSRFDPAVTG